MTKRKITKIDDLEFEPFNKYGSIIPGWSWHKISFDKETNFGTYISKLESGTKGSSMEESLPKIYVK